MHPLAIYRAEHGLTQESLAIQLRVGKNTVSRWEAGVRKIRLSKVVAISLVTGIPVGVLRPDLAKIMAGME